MDPYDEQRLREEVIYLHSLWHQGPPPPPPRSSFSSIHPPLHHHLSNPTQFNREWLQPRSFQRDNLRKKRKWTNPIQDSGKEWPSNPIFPSNFASTSVWNPQVLWPSEQPEKEWHIEPSSSNLVSTSVWNSQALWPSEQPEKEWPVEPASDNPPPTSGWLNSQPIYHSTEEQGWFVANKAQFKAIKATKEFFRPSNNDDEDEEDAEEEIGEDSESDDDDLSEEYRFFVKVFEEDRELREYYEKNYKNGEFSCLVCSGLGIMKPRKRFKDGVALIQHSISVARTKKRFTHRAYGKAVCKVLGWDIDQLPAIVSQLAENVGVSLSNSCANEGETQEKASSSNAEKPVDIGKSGELQEKASTSNETLLRNDEPTVSEKSMATAAETFRGDEDYNMLDPKVVEDKDSGQSSGMEKASSSNAEKSVDIGESGKLQEKASTSNKTLPSNDESMVSERTLAKADTFKSDEDGNLSAPKVVEDKDLGQPSGVKSLAAADTFLGGEDCNLSAPEVVEDNESGQPSDVGIPKEDAVVGDEGKDVVPDDLCEK